MDKLSIWFKANKLSRNLKNTKFKVCKLRQKRSICYTQITRRCGSVYLGVVELRRMILLTCLIADKQLSLYPTRENKSFILLLC